MNSSENGKVCRDYSSKNKKVVCDLQLKKNGKVRLLHLGYRDLSAPSLRRVVDTYISRAAQVTTDDWRGYRLISDHFRITQIPSNRGHNFNALHTMIHQVKSWIRRTYSWVSKKHILRYLNEFSFRLNRSQSKATIFNNLIRRMVEGGKLSHAQIVCS